MLSAAFDRNGVSELASNMTAAKIGTYSSARSIMVALGTQNVLRINNYPVTRAEKDQYVPTAMVPNIAASLVDDVTAESTV